MTPSDPVDAEVEAIMAKLEAAFVSNYMHYNGFTGFIPRPSDVFIVSYMKSGTTLLQQMSYQILCAAGRVPADPDGECFNDISEVVPFIEPRQAIGLPEARHASEPRVWKTHELADKLAFAPDVGRFLYCVRDGRQVAASLLDFVVEWVTGMHVRNTDVKRMLWVRFFLGFFLDLRRGEDGAWHREEGRVGRWLEHMKGWLEAEHEHVLFLVFDEMVNDLAGTARRVAKFIGAELDETQVSTVVKKCGKERMAADKRFNDTTISKLNGWDIEGGVRVRADTANSFRKIPLPEEAEKWYDTIFKETFGVETYAELVEIAKARCTE